ncbi:MAG: small basic protein [Candidatus Brocadiia bacterium]
MSLHKSLKRANQHTRTRNVLTREEQIEKLEEDGEWDEGDSVFGLPKVKVETISLRRKPAPEEEEEEEEAAAEELAEGAEEGTGGQVAEEPA